jgi:hypothetical protein
MKVSRPSVTVGFVVFAAISPYFFWQQSLQQPPSPNPEAPASVGTIYVKSAYDDGTDTGDVHILLSDGTEYTPAKEPGSVGSDMEQVAPDRQTVGWAAEYLDCCTSYRFR